MKPISMRDALEDIAAWALPETGRFWDEEKTRPTSYESEYGSNGAREYMRALAAAALAAQPASEPLSDTGIDFSLKAGDCVTHPNWALTRLYVVDVNWALRSVAVRLGSKGAVVVWPVRGLRKVVDSHQTSAAPAA